MALSTMIFRRLYKGASFDSRLFKVIGPFVNFADRLAQKSLSTDADGRIPPFTLRARSAGVLNQFGGRRFTQSSFDFLKFIEGRDILSDVEKSSGETAPLVFDIGCGVGKFPRSLQVNDKKVRYIGVDIDKISIDYCRAKLGKPGYEYFLIDVNNGTYRPSGNAEPLSEEFEMVEDESAKLIVAWSVFTHMELEHIRHYLSVMQKKLSKDGTALVSAFVHDERSLVNDHLKYEYNGGYVVNIENPMKAIGFKKDVFLSAFEEAGLTTVGDFIPKQEPGKKNDPEALGQDLFVLRKK